MVKGGQSVAFLLVSPRVMSEGQIFKGAHALTVASLLHEPEFAGGPVSRQSDHVKILSSCVGGGGKKTQQRPLNITITALSPDSQNK